LKEKKSITTLDLHSKNFLFLVLLHQHSKDNKIGDTGACNYQCFKKKQKQSPPLTFTVSIFSFPCASPPIFNRKPDWKTSKIPN
jgi:hypothetical protein